MAYYTMSFAYFLSFFFL